MAKRNLTCGALLLCGCYFAAISHRRAERAEEELELFHCVAPSLNEHTVLTSGLLECQAESQCVCFEPHFDTLTLKRQLHKFTLCQINQ